MYYVLARCRVGSLGKKRTPPQPATMAGRERRLLLGLFTFLLSYFSPSVSVPSVCTKNLFDRVETRGEV